MASGKVAAQLAVGSFPSAERLSIRVDSSRDAEVMQQTIVWDTDKIAAVDLHGLLQRPAAQFHVPHGKGFDLP